MNDGPLSNMYWFWANGQSQFAKVSRFLFGGVWWCLVVSGGVWWCLVVSGGVWWCLVVSGGARWCSVVFGGVWWCLVVFGGVWWCQVFPITSRFFQKIFSHGSENEFVRIDGEIQLEGPDVSGATGRSVLQRIGNCRLYRRTQVWSKSLMDLFRALINWSISASHFFWKFLCQICLLTNFHITCIFLTNFCITCIFLTNFCVTCVFLPIFVSRVFLGQFLVPHSVFLAFFCIKHALLAFFFAVIQYPISKRRRIFFATLPTAQHRARDSRLRTRIRAYCWRRVSRKRESIKSLYSSSIFFILRWSDGFSAFLMGIKVSGGFFPKFCASLNLPLFSNQFRQFFCIKATQYSRLLYSKRLWKEHYTYANILHVPRADHTLTQNLKGIVLPLLHRLEWFNLQETDKIPGFCFLAGQTDIRLHSQNFLCEPMKVAELSGVLFASCSNKPKRGKKCNECKSLYQNILKLLFCGLISLLQRKTTPLPIPPHMGKRCAIWPRSSIGTALVRVRQPLCSELSAMTTHLFHRSGLKHYSTIRLLTLHVKFNGISQRTPEMEHLPWTAFTRCIWNTLFPIKAPFAKQMLLFWYLHFLSAFFHKLSSEALLNILKIQTESYFHLTMLKWPISHCKTVGERDFSTIFETLLVTWRPRKKILSPAPDYAQDHILNDIFDLKTRSEIFPVI